MTFQTTKILGAAPGVQYGGVQDNSTGAPKVDLSVAVVVGRFRRGRIDRMFAVTKESIRARLGYQPSNPDYQVVQDALDLGVPQVWVRRIRGVIAGGEVPPPQPIGCAGATTEAATTLMDGLWVVSIDDTELPGSEWVYIVSTLSTLGIQIVSDIEANTTVFTNSSGEPYRLRLEPVDASPVEIAASNSNPTLFVDGSDVVTFCFAPAV